MWMENSFSCVHRRKGDAGKAIHAVGVALGPAFQNADLKRVLTSEIRGCSAKSFRCARNPRKHEYLQFSTVEDGLDTLRGGSSYASYEC